MYVGLVYNAKPFQRADLRRGRPPEILLEEDEEPPSLAGVGSEEDLWAEWDDAETILAVARALAQKHRVTLFEAVGDFAGRLRKHPPDMVFNIAEGSAGVHREAQVPAVLEMLGIPYTGSDPLTLALCLDKAWTKMILGHAGVPTAPFRIVTEPGALALADEVPLPAMVKPLYEGSSKGIRDDHLARDRGHLREVVLRTLAEYRQPVLVEAFLPGREFTVGFIGNGPDLRLLPPVEIRFDQFPAGSAPIYSWEAKWVWDRPEAPLRVFECPARLTPAERARIEDVCRGTIAALRLRDWSRIDLREDADGVVNVIEVNPLPGVLPDPDMNSCFPKAARSAGLSYEAMILEVLDAGLRRRGGTA
ncbi:MAG: D-alanine--D-alanine ligase [Pseudomonadota bacterium]